MESVLVPPNVNQLFDIGEILEFSQTSGREFLITTTVQKFALRKLKFASQMKRMFYDIAFTDYLSKQGFPARKFIKTRDGSIVIDIDGEKYFMIEYFIGVSKPSGRDKLNNLQLAEAANMLAQLHILASRYQGPKFQHIPFQSRRNYQTLRDVFSAIDRKSALSDFDKLTLQVIKTKLEFIAKHPFEKQNFLYENRMMNHGDYHAGNMVFGPDNKILAVLDFEFCTDMPRIWDIAWALTWLCRERCTEAFSGMANLERMALFMRQYNQAYSLSLSEKTSLVEMCISASYHTTYLLEHFYIQGSGYSELEQCQSLDEWFWWLNNQNIISEVLLSN